MFRLDALPITIQKNTKDMLQAKSVAPWCRGILVITVAQLHSRKPPLSTLLFLLKREESRGTS